MARVGTHSTEELPAVSQRTEAQGLVLTPRLAHEDTSGLPLADVVEAGSARKILFLRLSDRNQKSSGTHQLRSNESSCVRERRERTGADVATVAPWMRVIAHSQSLGVAHPEDGFGLPTSTTPARPRYLALSSHGAPPPPARFGGRATACRAPQSCHRRRPDS